MIFSRPPMFRKEDAPTNITRGLKDGNIKIEGKWSNIRSIVQDLLDDGWRYTAEPTGEPSGFMFTEVELTREWNHSK